MSFVTFRLCGVTKIKQMKIFFDVKLSKAKENIDEKWKHVVQI